jgi:hypothetical protein
MKRPKTLTKRERKALAPARAPQQGSAAKQGQHIHCIACGRHIEPSEFNAPATATRVTCQHRSTFAACVGCVDTAKALLAEHDRTGQPVRTASAWH